MRLFAFIALWFLPAGAFASGIAKLSADTSHNTIIDYPQVLQKAGVKGIRCIFKDSRKFIWIGTVNGLYRYDGTNVDLLQHDPGDPHSLPDNTVVAITEDRQGQIWAGTLQGAARIGPWTFSCRTFNRRAHNLDEDYDIKVFVDGDGQIWAYGSQGLDLFNLHTAKFRKVWQAPKKDRSGVEYINSIADWKNDTLAMGTFDGAVLINKRNFASRRLLQGSHIAVTRVYSAVDGRLWLGTWAWGCYILDEHSRHLDHLQFETGKNGELANVITGIIGTAYNHDDVLWMSTLRGVYKLTGSVGGASDKGTISIGNVLHGNVSAIMADNDQYIWAVGGTVSRFFAGRSFFTPMPIAYSGAIQDIEPITIKGKRLIATLSWYASSGLVVSDLAGKIIYKQPLTSNDEANVGAIAQDKYGRLWVSSLGGVSVLDDNFKQIYNLNNAQVPGDRLSSNKTDHLVINHDTVWIACYKKAVDLYDLNFHKIKSFQPGDASGLKDDYIQRTFADSRGDVWLCGNNQLYEYLSAIGKFKALNFNRDSTSFSVNCIAELPNGDLLIASQTGLFRLNPGTYAYTRISSPLIDDNRIQAVAVDAAGDIWFMNTGHLVWYQEKNHHFTLFGKEDGLGPQADLEWLRIVDHKHCYLATNGRIVSFIPGSEPKPIAPVKLYFHDISVNDSALVRDHFGGKLSLRYNENRLNIGFGAINYIKPEQNIYAYQLSGIDDRWIYTARNFASYANLAPGSYTLKLKAANYAGIWSNPISMTIVVSPPFWATWWFRLLSVLVIGSLLFVSVRYVLQRNLREKILKLEKEQAVEKERNRIASDMHDDLGSGLTKIAILSEVAKTQIASPDHASANLDVISAASRELVDNLQDIIWVLNPRNDSLNSLILYIREYTESFFEPAGVNYEFSCDDMERRLTLSEEQRRNIFLAVKESCNNILKHAEASSVCISLKLKHNSIIITIKDNGRGFDRKEVGNFSNGLQNIHNRMRQINATCVIESVKNGGTAVELHIPV
jgi:signal transduction histidine kinase/ligand-binding sensor domain-containing protein